MITEDKVALIDLDGTIANYDKAMLERQTALQSPGEAAYSSQLASEELPYLQARRKLIQQSPGFWIDLEPIPMGFEVLEELRKLKFSLNVLTKAPAKNKIAWGEKAEWCYKYIPDALITISEQKHRVYGRVLFDDFPPYFEKWLEVRPRGLVICLAHPWNKEFEKGGSKEHPQIFRYDGSNKEELVKLLTNAFERKSN